jgi:UDP-N-acetylglucosamine pyrophosphorylase
LNLTNPSPYQVAERTSSDKKGGHLAKRKSDGRLVLRESAMTPDGDKDAFEDIGKHKFFNTNNLWVNLEKLQVRILGDCSHISKMLLKTSENK